MVHFGKEDFLPSQRKSPALREAEAQVAELTRQLEQRTAELRDAMNKRNTANAAQKQATKEVEKLHTIAWRARSAPAEWQRRARRMTRTW